MRDRSDFNEALTKLHRLHQESGEERLAPIPFWQYQQCHPSSSGRIPGGAYDNEQESPQLSSRAKRHDRTVRPVVCRLFTKPQTCRLSRFFRFVAVRSFTADSSLLQPTRWCKHHTSHVHFSWAIHSDTCARVWLALISFVISCFMRIVVCFSDCLDISIHFSFLIFSLIALFFLPPINFIFQVVVDKYPLYFR